MRHARDEDLDVLEPLLADLRRLDGLTERRRGNFGRGSRAFLHFHEHHGGYFADVKLVDEFERRPVSTRAEQRALVTEVRAALRG